MKPAPLRTEFLIAGAGMLLAVLWGYEACHYRYRSFWPSVPGASYLLSGRAPSGAWIFATAVILGTAYVLGAFIVQLTFNTPTMPMIDEIRKRRMLELRQIDLGLIPGPSESRDREKLLKLAFDNANPFPPSYLLALILTSGRARFSDELAAEYVYRRGNRQVFVGIIPTVYLVAVDIGLTTNVLLPRSHWPYQFIGATVSLVALILVHLKLREQLKKAARYQETVAQTLILDSAFLERWDA